MNPQVVRADNFRTYEHLEVDLPIGCVAVLGVNGSGKSSLVALIDVGLFGPESRSLVDYHSEGALDDLMIELELEHAGAQYRIRRTYSPRGRGKTTLDFEELVEGEWTPRTCESTTATQAAIEATIGLSRQTFCASAMLRQGDSGAFTEAAPRDRKKILSEVLGLEQWTVLAECARVDRRLLETRAAALTRRAGQAEEQAALLPQLERDHSDVTEAATITADNVADLERSHQAVAVEYQEAREHAALRAAADAELKTAENELAALTTRARDAAKAAADRALLADQAEKLPTYPPDDELRARETVLVAACDAHSEAVRAHQAIVEASKHAERERADLLSQEAAKRARIAQLQERIEQIQDGELDACPTCKQSLGVEARGETIKSLAAEAAAELLEASALRNQAAEVVIPVVPAAPAGEPPTVELAVARQAITASNAAALERATLVERIRQCDLVAASGPGPDVLAVAREAVLAKQARIEAVGSPPDVAAITAQGQLVAEQLRTARAALDGHRQQRARLDERITVARAAAEQLQAIAGDRATLQADVDVVAALERAFSPDGIPALIVENSAIPYLETEANRILAALGTSFRVELRTQAALKSGDGLRDTLDVIVCSEAGERPYETFSGGERTRINLALRIALARLLAHRRGAESRLLCVDEPEYLDEQGTAALVDVLRSLEGDFDKLYIVSHVPGLRDSFDTTLSVVRDEQGSRVVEAGVFEAVAA